MLTIDELLRAYEAGEITRNELFGHLLAVLTPSQVETARVRLRKEEGCLQAFEEWLDDVRAGAVIFLGSLPVRISDEARTAIALWRERTQTERYARLAAQMTDWMSQPHKGEPVFNPDEVEPFRSSDIDQLIPEAA